MDSAQQDPQNVGVGAGAKAFVGEASELVDHTLQLKSSWEKRLHETASEHPYLSLATASAAGFVAGGGLTFMLTRRLWLVGARLGMSFALQQLSQSDMVHSWLGAQKPRR